LSDQAAEHTAPARPDNCLANIEGDYPRCAKCGRAWSKKSGQPAPPCDAMTLTRMADFLLAEIERAEQSARALIAIAESKPDWKADPLESFDRAAKLQSVLRLVGRIKKSDAILDILNPARVAQRERQP
jgi:hypothetical protein